MDKVGPKPPGVEGRPVIKALNATSANVNTTAVGRFISDIPLYADRPACISSDRTMPCDSQGGPLDTYTVETTSISCRNQ
jgi:hypothetical protein